MSFLNSRNYFIYSLDSRLTKRIYFGLGNSSKIDGTSDTMIDAVRFAQPLVRFQERTGININIMNTQTRGHRYFNAPFTQDNTTSILLGNMHVSLLCYKQDTYPVPS